MVYKQQNASRRVSLGTTLLNAGTCSLVPRPPPFLPFVCVHNNEDQRKWERPESICHVSRHKVDVGGEGPMFEYVYTKLESKSLSSQDA